MKDYGKLEPTFWTRGSGKQLRGNPEAQVVACYLFSCSASNYIGIYHLAIPTLAHETGIPLEGASKALTKVCEVGIGAYDEDAELAYVFGLIIRNVGEEMKPTDNRVVRLERELDHVGIHPFAKDFLKKYRDRYGLRVRPALEALQSSFASPFEAPLKPVAVSVAVDGAVAVPGRDRTLPGFGLDSLSDQERAVHSAIVGDESLRPIVRDPVTLTRDLLAAAPGVNVPSQVKRAGAWLRANPAKKKSNGAKFLLSWMTKEQDERGGRNGVSGSRSSTPPESAVDRANRLERERRERDRQLGGAS